MIFYTLLNEYIPDNQGVPDSRMALLSNLKRPAYSQLLEQTANKGL